MFVVDAPLLLHAGTAGVTPADNSAVSSQFLTLVLTSVYIPTGQTVNGISTTEAQPPGTVLPSDDRPNRNSVDEILETMRMYDLCGFDDDEDEESGII